MRKRHPEQAGKCHGLLFITFSDIPGSRPRTGVGLVFDPTSPDMVPNLQIEMSRHDRHGVRAPSSTHARNEDRADAPTS